jgi:hypothetical protein
MKKRNWVSLSLTPQTRAVLIAGIVLAVIGACTGDLGRSGTEFDDILSITVDQPVAARGLGVENFAVTSLGIVVTQVSTGSVIDTISWVPANGTTTYDLPVPGAGLYRIAVDHNGTNPAGDTVTAAESATVSIQPMLIAVVTIVPGQIGLIRVVGADPVSLEFPSPTATICNVSGYCTTLGSGSRRFYRAGDFLEQTLTGTGLSSISGLDLSFDMQDYTTTSCTVGLLEWDVSVNGTVVGSYEYNGGGSLGRISFNESYTFASVVGTGSNLDNYAIRLEATTTVCPGASAWSWLPGGTATLRP